jgi:hypothetical protein
LSNSNSNRPQSKLEEAKKLKDGDDESILKNEDETQLNTE